MGHPTSKTKLPSGAASLYALLFPNGKRYSGISSQPQTRWTRHAAHAENGSKLRVHAAIRKYGFNAVRCVVIAIGEPNYIRTLEIAAIAAFGTQNRQFGYNITDGGQSAPDMRGRPLSESHRLALSQSQRRRFAKPLERAALSEGQRRRYSDPNERTRHGESQRRRFERSDEREKTRRGALRQHAESGAREKNRLAHLGMPWSETRRAAETPQVSANRVATRRANGSYNFSESHLNKLAMSWTEERRLRHGEFMRRFWATRKAKGATAAGATELRVEVMNGAVD